MREWTDTDGEGRGRMGENLGFGVKVELIGYIWVNGFRFLSPRWGWQEEQEK